MNFLLAQYSASEVPVPGVFDWSAAALACLSVIGVALAAVGAYKISVGIGKRIIEYYGIGGRSRSDYMLGGKHNPMVKSDSRTNRGRLPF